MPVMHSYVILLRGINVGGNNKIPMAALKQCLEDVGFTNVSTYIASGNAIVQSGKSPDEIKAQIEAALPKTFKLNNELIKVLVLSRAQLEAIVKRKPKGFGDQPEKYHSDVIFLIDSDAEQALPIFNPRAGVDTIWPGDGVIYSQRVSALRAKSRLSAIAMSPLYKSLTIRGWNTTVKLLDLLKI